MELQFNSRFTARARPPFQGRGGDGAGGAAAEEGVIEANEEEIVSNKELW